MENQYDWSIEKNFRCDIILSLKGGDIMSEEKVYKKVHRKLDQHLEKPVEAKHGKQKHQKIKPYIVLQYLMKYSDEENVYSAYDLVEILDEYKKYNLHPDIRLSGTPREVLDWCKKTKIGAMLYFHYYNYDYKAVYDTQIRKKLLDFILESILADVVKHHTD